ncbi:hypothetical protein SLS56_008540 [Neofusicoccum ribis]|uniref:Nudix hydrolase domain-containing protein n=1 Tax=Neofusicoccum ribis TaxID=45134 RepID=A0ABR3SKP5_9PEZI
MEKVNKTNLDLINDCDNFPRHDLHTNQYNATVAGLYTLHVAGHDEALGFLLPHVAETLQGLPAWTLSPESRTLTLSAAAATPAARTAAVAQTTAAMRATGHFQVLRGWRDEAYPVYGAGGELLFTLERAASPLFGVHVCSVNMTCYVVDETGCRHRFWVPRRARAKQTYGGMLDNTVAGGLPAGEAPLDALVREAEEEAALPPELVRRDARAAGCVSYFLVRDEKAGGETGLLQPESQLVYDLRLREGDGVEPRVNDGEVEGFALLTTEEVQEALRRGEFKPNTALVMLDFFVRHGILTPENEPDYAEIVSRLHRRLQFPGPRRPGF